ncbi:MAG: HAD-IA family hydrolase [Paludibacter sp.]|nr:HAD-IA family hydrolase [Paludibacter sp.]
MLLSEIEIFKKKNKYPDFKPKAIFFDMDGVLFDSMKFHAVSWLKAMLQVGLPFTETEAYMNEGRTGASTIDNVFVAVRGRNATEKEKKEIYKIKSTHFEACGKIERMPFALELLQKIKAENKDIFVVTGSGQPSLIDSLQENFPDIFKKEKMVTAFDVTNGKPHPEPYLKALKKSGLQPWEVVVIENAPLGVESANAAGLFTIAVNTGPLNPEVLSNSGANLVLKDMEDLYVKWDKLF